MSSTTNIQNSANSCKYEGNMHLGARLRMRGLPSLRSVCLGGVQLLTRLATYRWLASPLRGGAFKGQNVQSRALCEAYLRCARFASVALRQKVMTNSAKRCVCCIYGTFQASLMCPIYNKRHLFGGICHLLLL